MSSTKSEALQTHFVGLPQSPADLISYRNNTCYITPISMAQDPLQPFLEYFMDLNNIRRDSTFPTFVKRTNEKDQTTQITAAFMDETLPKLMKACQVLDIGMGEGDLSTKVASYMQGKCENVRYEGIDQSFSFIFTSRLKLIALGIENNHVMVGDCFGGDIDRLITSPTLLIASQVIFYAPDIQKFIDSIIKKLGMVALIIGQANNSFLSQVNKRYGPSYKQKDGEEKLDGILNEQETVHSAKVFYNSIIEFPNNIDLFKVATGVLEAPKNSSVALITPKEREAREILEFVAGTPLEYMEMKGQLQAFIKEVDAHLKRNHGVFQFWNFMSILMEATTITEAELQARWMHIQKQKFIRNLNLFESALHEGNSLMVRDVLNQGIVLSDLREGEQEHENIVLSAVYDTALSLASVLPFAIPIFEPNKLTHFFTFQRNVFHKDTFHYLPLAADFVDDEAATLIIKNFMLHAKDCKNDEPRFTTLSEELTTKNYIFIKQRWNIQLIFVGLLFYLNAFGYPLGDDWPPLVKKTIPYGLIATFSAIKAYVIYNYFRAGDSNLHAFARRGNEQSVQLLLQHPKTLLGINDQTREGRTALHIALMHNHSAIADSLLEAGHTAVNLPDYQGNFPIHYATQEGNIDLVKHLKELGADINSQASNSRKLLFDKPLRFGLAIATMFYTTLALKLLISSIPTKLFLDFNFSIQNELMVFNSFSLLFGVMTHYVGIKLPESPYFIFPFTFLEPSIFGNGHSTNIDATFAGYTYDTPLHIAVRENYTELANFLLDSRVKPNRPNDHGITPLHLAAGNGNAYLTEKLLENSYVNAYAQRSSDPYTSLFTLFMMNYCVSNSMGLFIGGISFLKILYEDKVFDAFQDKSSGTPLHYAVAGLNISDISRAHPLLDAKNSSEDALRAGIVAQLINRGANPDVTLRVASESSDQISHYLLLRFLLKLATYSLKYVTINHYRQNPAFLASTNTVGLEFLPYLIFSLNPSSTSYLKPIDLVAEMVSPNGCPGESASALEASCTPQPSKVYQTLKQYTTLNEYKDVTDVERMSFFNLEYLSHKLGLRSEDDTIHMKEYGAYTGGTGRDTFVIHPYYLGQKEGRHLIIKDFNEEGDLIDLSHFNSLAFDDLEMGKIRIMGKDSLLIYTHNNSNRLRFILYGRDPRLPVVETFFMFSPQQNDSESDDN